jgi:alpha-1,3-mannosyl-glycoprotein beta-1,2-N-acetylglucosaminyltransferase
MRLPTTTSRRVGNTSKNSDYGNETQRTGDEDHDDDDRYSNEAIGGSTTASSSSRPTSLVGRHRRRRTFADVVNKRLIFMGIVILITSWIAGFLATYIWVSYYESDKSMPTGESFGSVAKNINNRDANYDSPLLIFTCRREKYLKETLETLLKYIPHGCQFGCPVIVSEDGKHDPIEAVINGLRPRFDEIGVPLVHMVHTKNLRRDVSKGASAYVALAQHYKWALTTIFERKFGRIDDPEFPNPHRVIILEEDIRVAPDFFEYMKATAPILDNDSTLFAVSAFNDNGHQGVSDPTRLLRSDFFPGLGWMLTSSLWEEVKVKWPDGYWDDWLRDPLQRKGRQVIRPEISTFSNNE